METQKRIVTDKEKEDYYLSVKNLIWSIAHQFNNVSQEDKEDLFQEASAHLVNSVVYSYDPTRNVAFKDFAYTCIRNFMLRKINQMSKIKKVVISNDDLLSSCSEEQVDCSVYEDITKIDKLKSLLESGSDLIKEKERVVLLMIVENPKITQREIAERMGFSYASGAGAILSRFRDRARQERFLEED